MAEKHEEEPASHRENTANRRSFEWLTSRRKSQQGTEQTGGHLNGQEATRRGSKPQEHGPNRRSSEWPKSNKKTHSTQAKILTSRKSRRHRSYLTWRSKRRRKSYVHTYIHTHCDRYLINNTRQKRKTVLYNPGQGTPLL